MSDKEPKKILRAYVTNNVKDKLFKIVVGDKVLQKDLDFVIVDLLYNSVVKHIKINNCKINKKNFDKSLCEYLRAVKVNINMLYNLKH